MSTNWKELDSILRRSADKYKYYFGNYTYHDCAKGKLATEIPLAHLGWGKRAVEMRANKTHFDCFENDTLGLNDIMRKYDVIAAFEKVKEDVLVAGCGFLALAYGKVMPFAADEATGVYNWKEQNLKEGYAVFRRNSKDTVRPERPDGYIEYQQSEYRIYEDKDVDILTNPAGRPLMGVLTYNSTTKRPFGHSVLSRPVRDAIIDASRTARQAMIAAHYYNTKVDVILGVDSTTPIDKIETRTGDILKVGMNDDGQIPKLGELAQHAMAPFRDTILIAANNFCAATKLSLVNLGITTDAPQSTEALEIVNDDLKDDILAWQEELGAQLKYFAVTLWMYDNGVGKIDDNLKQKINATTPIWKPVFEADVSKFGDGLTKIAHNVPDIIKARSVWRNLGLSSEEIDMIIASTDAEE